LTQPLLERFGRVLALEMDESLVPPLTQRFGGSAVDVQHADALNADLDSLLEGESPWQVASNLPYSVGTAIVRRLLPRSDLISRVVVMLQREVARRLVARPGGKGHGLLALERAVWSDARFVFDVHPRAFRPPPKVVSSVVVLDLKPSSYDRDLVDRALAVAARALTKPRKMLSNAVGDSVTRDQIERAGIDPNARPGTLHLESWIELARQR
jgi:16S rRNA (adenine1518-N6/adenine1519-N6)-dimethyltransferase